MYRSLLSLLVLSLAAGCSNDASAPEAEGGGAEAGGSTATARPDRDEAALIRMNDRGVGLMGRYEYAEAHDLFAAVVEQAPDWLDARVNLAIATLNRQEEGDEATALVMLQDVLAEDPDHLRARYCAGILLGRSGRDDLAKEHFLAVAEADPADGYAAYHAGQAIERDDPERAEALLRQSIQCEPYLRSSYYRLFTVLRIAGRAEEAAEMLDIFQRLDTNPRGKTVKTIYTMLGPKAEVVPVGDQPVPVTPNALPDGPLFVSAAPLFGEADVPWRDGPIAAEDVSIAATDLDGDGDIDVVMTNVLGGDVVNAVAINGGDGQFELDPDHIFATVEDVNAVLFGDIDNDGLTDAYLCRNGPNHLWRQVAPGEWERLAADAGANGAGSNTRDGLLVDADHDGDLDVFCANAGPNELLSNNFDGTFRSIADSSGIAGSADSRRVLALDLDGTRDLDLVVINDAPPHEAYLNERLWSYRPAGELGGFLQSDVGNAIAADLDADGREEIITPGMVYGVGDDGTWGARSIDMGDPAFLAIDASGTGAVEALAASAVDADAPPVVMSDVLLDGARGPAVVGFIASADGQVDPQPRLWRAGSGRHPFVTLDLTGGEDAGKSMRTNYAAIGARVSVRTDQWTVRRRLRDSAGPGQSLQPMAFGTNGWPNLEFVEIDWPDGIFQSEVHETQDVVDGPIRTLAAGEVVEIAETERQVSSCPVLFAWDGNEFTFVSDVLGVGGMGYFVEPGVYGEPRPDERFLFPPDVLVPRDGEYRIKLAEPMEESCYLDAARLLAYDLPTGWDMVIDERFAIEGAPATGRPIFYRDVVRPKAASNDRGEDVLDSIIEVDYRAAPVGDLDRRFIGRLAQSHVLTVEFAAEVERDGAVLVVDGWVEYPYSQTMFAAWQAGAAYEAPSLEARGADGHWVMVAPSFGYPAGMPRRMALPLATLPAGTDALRLTTNQEIYWDSIFVAFEEPAPVEATVLSVSQAVLRRGGFALRTTGPQRLPHYDDAQRAPFWDTRHQTGLYTRFGDAGDLVRERDDVLAIFGPGEEIELAFVAPPAVPETRRAIVLDLRGWCKDMDLFTRDGETIEPIPGVPSKDRERRHATTMTRWESGR